MIHNVTVRIGNEDRSMTIEEAKRLISRILDAINATRVKCPTCRCMILPGSECSCCAQPEIDDGVDMDLVARIAPTKENPWP